LRQQILRFIDLLHDSPSDMDLFTDLAALIAQQVEFLREAPCSEIGQLASEIIQFLKKTRFSNANGQVGLSATHIQLMNMVMRLFRKLTVADLALVEIAVPYLGQCAQFTETESISLRFVHKGWLSTGLWLTSGTLCRVKLSRDGPATIVIQVGCHTRNIADHPPPWERWPEIVVSHTISARDAFIATPYGGFIYVMGRSLTKRSFSLTFSDVCMAPFYLHSDDERWRSTRDYAMPWAELQGQNFILTVPTELTSSIPSVPEAVALLSDLFATIHAFIGEPVVPHRAVVDVQLSGPGIELGYPTFIERRWAVTALTTSGPTTQLWQFLASIAVQGLPDHFLFPAIRAVIALLASMHALTKRWRSVPAFRLPHLEDFGVWRLLSSLMAMLGGEAFASCLQKARARIEQPPATGKGKAKAKDAVETFVRALAQRANLALDSLVLDELLATETHPWSPLEVIHGPG
jgi:hypothetical protein